MKISVDIKTSDIVKLNIWLALKSKGTYSLIALVFAALWAYAIFKHGIPNTTEKWVVTFLIALISGLRHFVPDFSQLLSPLSEVTCQRELK